MFPDGLNLLGIFVFPLDGIDGGDGGDTLHMGKLDDTLLDLTVLSSDALGDIEYIFLGTGLEADSNTVKLAAGDVNEHAGPGETMTIYGDVSDTVELAGFTLSSPGLAYDVYQSAGGETLRIASDIEVVV